MKSLIISAAAALLITATPSLAAPNQNNHDGNHGSSHNTTHVTRNVHVNRTVNVHRNVHVNRTVHTRSRHSNSGWHRGSTSHRTRGSNVHVRINIGGLHANINAPHRYHFGAYNRPSGWYAHRWTYGQRLPRGWYGGNYRISNYITFGLVAPPDGYQWVRVGNDALLIDVDTGEVVRVVYDVFY